MTTSGLWSFGAFCDWQRRRVALADIPHLATPQTVRAHSVPPRRYIASPAAWRQRRLLAHRQQLALWSGR